jgi:AcrR family transcriptional regulator
MDSQLSKDNDDATPGHGALSRADWIAAARDLLVTEGVEAVKILRLADLLQVTRGSFYWHFKDRADLLEALLRLWAGSNTRAVIEAAGTGPDLTAGILALFECWIYRERFDPRLDSAIRDWARRDPAVRRAVKRADDRRVAAIAALFERDGWAARRAFAQARVLYFTQVGYYALDLRETLETRMTYTDDYFEAYTGRKLDPALAAAFRQKHLRGGGKKTATRRPRR